MKWNKKIIAGTLCVVMVEQSFCGGNSLLVQAAEAPSEKEEVVYGMLDNTGNVEGVYVVNSFAGGDIVDYGTYTDVRNLNTMDKISVDGDCITLQSDAAKVYYQGNLETKNLPWNIEIRYKLDGEECEPKELAGKSGALEITIHITENENVEKAFWEGFALQATLLLDTGKCSHIQAEGATIANVGSDKQLSYIIMPGKGGDFTITADVEDFEMDEISINGTKLNLNMELEDGQLKDKVSELQDGVSNLNDGAGELKDGADSLEDGIAQIKKALETLNGNSSTLTSGSTQVLTALTTIQASLQNVEFDKKQLKELSAASTKIKKGTDSLVNGLDTVKGSIATYNSALQQAGVSDTSTFVKQHKQAIAALNITDTQRTLYSAYTKDGDKGVIQELAELAGAGDKEALSLYQKYQSTGATAIKEYITAAGTAVSIETLLKGDIAYIQGSDALISGIDDALDSKNGELMTGAISLQKNYAVFDKNIQKLCTSLQSLAGNMTTLKTGIDKLVSNYQTLDGGIEEYTDAVAQIVDGYDKIYQGSVDLSKGSADLYEGTNTFSDKTGNMDTEIQDTITQTIDDMTGKNVETVSFVSEKNTNIDSVLFVMKTPSIKKEEVEKTEEKTQELSIKDKFLQLFSKNK